MIGLRKARESDTEAPYEKNTESAFVYTVDYHARGLRKEDRPGRKTARHAHAACGGGNTDSDADTDADADPDADTDTDADCNSDAHADPDAYADTGTDPDAHTDPDTHADA